MVIRFMMAALVALAPAALTPAAQAADDALSPEQKAAVESVVRDYLRDHPEVIVEAFQAMQARQEAAEDARSRETIATLSDQLYADSGVPVAGNPNGDITVVEFFDYRCGYCKSVAPGVMETVRTDGNVRLVLREFPILGPASVFASRAALATWNMAPDRYMDFHSALIGSTGNLTEAKVLRLAEGVGLDMDRLRTAMDDPAVQAEIDQSYELAKALQIRGTPAFVIGGKLVPGAISPDTLKNLIAEARAGQS